MKFFYSVLCLLGIVLPYSQFLPWVLEHGLNLSQLVQEAASTRTGAFTWLDVIVSAVVLLGLIWQDGKRWQMRYW